MMDSFATVMGIGRGTAGKARLLTLGARVRGNEKRPLMEGREGIVRRADPASDVMEVQLYDEHGKLQKSVNGFRVCELDLIIDGRVHDLILPDTPISDMP